MNLFELGIGDRIAVIAAGTLVDVRTIAQKDGKKIVDSKGAKWGVHYGERWAFSNAKVDRDFCRPATQADVDQLLSDTAEQQAMRESAVKRSALSRLQWTLGAREGGIQDSVVNLAFGEVIQDPAAAAWIEANP